MTALLLALQVTRHVVDGAVCAYVSGISPTAESVEVGNLPPGSSSTIVAIAPGTESVCVPLWSPHENNFTIRAQTWEPVGPNPPGGETGNVRVHQASGFVEEVPVCCECVVGMADCTGCDSKIYPKCQP